MLHLTNICTKDHPLRILCLGAHSDDIEIGCGGTIRFKDGSSEIDSHKPEYETLAGFGALCLVDDLAAISR